MASYTTVEVRVDIDLELLCSRCGNDLVGSCPVTGRATIDPCKHCLDEAYEEGNKDGYARDISDGRDGE